MDVLSEGLEHVVQLGVADEHRRQPHAALEAHVLQQPRTTQVTLDDADARAAGAVVQHQADIVARMRVIAVRRRSWNRNPVRPASAMVAVHRSSNRRCQ